MVNKPYVLELNIQNSNKKIINKNKNFSPLSGSELDYNPELWNNDELIKHSHNCYSYALGTIVKKLKSKAQPGYASGFNSLPINFECNTLKKRLKKDSPGSYIESFDNACLPGFYKIFLAIDPKNDYHWWVQNSNKYWSHKPGSSNATNLDASKKKIKNPLLSDRKFNHRDYYKPCFFACIYSDLSRSLDEIYL